MKIALVSTGLGHVWRGYERFAYDLFHLLKGEMDIYLFKGGGVSNEREIVLPHVKRDGILSLVRPLRGSYRDSYYFETLSFFAFLLPRLISGRYDLVHFTECPLANFFFHVRTKFNLRHRFKTLFTNGNPILDEACMRVDFLHQLTPGQVKAVVDFGVPRERIFEVPFGIHCERFGRSVDRRSLRAQYGIGQDQIVILAVSAINRSHKRIDYLIQEVARLGTEYFLLVAGHVEDGSVERMARQLLGDRFKFVHLPFQEANALYGLADLFVMCSLIEGFGLALVEAMSARIPVIAHASDHYRWMIGDDRCLTDLRSKGALARQIEKMMEDQRLISELVERNYASTRQRFDWSVLKESYLSMYHRIGRGASVSKSERLSGFDIQERSEVSK